MTRRESRETAFTLLFEWSFKDDTLDDIIETAKTARGVEVDDFALSLLEKATRHREEIDALIEQYAQGWKLSRISRTALAVLRLSFCEMTRLSDIPVGATINEAVELLKKFGTDEEAAYINGILGSFERVRKGLKPAPQKSPARLAIPQNENADKPQEDINDAQTPDTGSGVELADDIIIEVD